MGVWALSLKKEIHEAWVTGLLTGFFAAAGLAMLLRIWGI